MGSIDVKTAQLLIQVISIQVERIVCLVANRNLVRLCQNLGLTLSELGPGGSCTQARGRRVPLLILSSQ